MGRATEIAINTTRPDGSLRPFVPIWVVRVGDRAYVRSYRGPAAAWYRHAHRNGRARARIAGHELDLAVEPLAMTADQHDDIDRAYRSKYAEYGGGYVDPMVANAAKAATLRLLPADRHTNAARSTT